MLKTLNVTALQIFTILAKLIMKITLFKLRLYERFCKNVEWDHREIELLEKNDIQT